MKKILTLLMAMLLAVALFAGCTTQKPSPTEAPDNTGATPEPATGEKQTLSVFTWFAGQENWGAKDFNDIRCYQVLEEKTGVHIDWSMLSDTNKFDLMMSSGQTTDIIWYSWPPSRQQQYAKAGLIRDINPLLEENGPDILAAYEQYPEAKKQVTSPDGAVYIVPWITADKILVTGGEGFGIRQDWLDKLNLPMPKTPEELANTLIAFRDQDANGNGQNDEVLTGYPSQLKKIFFGFGANYSSYQLNADGKTVEFAPVTDNYKAALKWFADLYDKGVIDPDYTSWDGDIYEKKVMEDRVGMYVDNAAVLTGFELKAKDNGLTIDYAPMPYLQNDGKAMSYNTTAKRVAQHYSATVASSCADPALAVSWLNNFFTEEGNVLMNWGVEGESYTIDADGNKVLTEQILNAPDGAAVEMSKYAHASFAGPEITAARFATFDEEAKKFADTWSQVDISQAMEPYIFYTEEQAETIKQYKTELNDAVNTWADKFMTGAADVDAEWDAYVAELEGFGYKEVLAAEQAALDAYLAK